MPLVFRSDETELPPTLAAERAAAETRAQAIRADPGFAARVAEAFLMAEPERPTPEYPEQRIYDGFASRQDRERATAFHDAPPRGKVEIVRAIADERFREFGFRIIHERWPDTLMAAERADRERRLAERLSAPPGVPWTSVPAARAAIAELLPDADEARRSILQGYARWLDARFGPARQGPAGPTDGDALA